MPKIIVTTKDNEVVREFDAETDFDGPDSKWYKDNLMNDIYDALIVAWREEEEKKFSPFEDESERD